MHVVASKQGSPSDYDDQSPQHHSDSLVRNKIAIEGLFVTAASLSLSDGYKLR